MKLKLDTSRDEIKRWVHELYLKSKKPFWKA